MTKKVLGNGIKGNWHWMGNNWFKKFDILVDKSHNSHYNNYSSFIFYTHYTLYLVKYRQFYNLVAFLPLNRHNASERSFFIQHFIYLLFPATLSSSRLDHNSDGMLLMFITQLLWQFVIFIFDTYHRSSVWFLYFLFASLHYSYTNYTTLTA